MRSALTSLFGGIAIAVAAFTLPAQAFAASAPFFYGPILNCTGYFTINAEVTDPGAKESRSVVYTPVSDNAVPNNPNSSDPDAATLPSCVSLCDVFILFNNLIRFGVSILITIFTPVMFAIGGFYYMFSGANPGRRATGQRIITGTLIGTVIILLSGLIVSQIMTLVFRETWGDQLRAQAAATGVDISKVPDFTWNTLSCSAQDGGVKITPSKTTPANTPKTNTPQTTQAPKASCTSASVKDQFTCVSGWTTHPDCSKESVACVPAKDHACTAVCSKTSTPWGGVTTKDGKECLCGNTGYPVTQTTPPIMILVPKN